MAFTSVAKVRIASLKQALNYGEHGLNVAIQSLQDESPQVQIQAYYLLTSRTELKVKQALLKFNPQSLKLEPIEVVTVNSYGEIIQHQQRLARYFTENLGNGVLNFICNASEYFLAIHKSIRQVFYCSKCHFY